MKCFMVILAFFSCLRLSAMQAPEEAEIAALAAEFSADFKQYQKIESQFRAVCMQKLFFLNKKPLVQNSPYYNFKQRLQKLEQRKSELAAQLLPGRAEYIENAFIFYCKTQNYNFNPGVAHALQSWKKDQN